MTFTIRSLALGAVAVVALAATSFAQTGTPILNTLEVRKLVAAGEPGDNVKFGVERCCLVNAPRSSSASPAMS